MGYVFVVGTVLMNIMFHGFLVASNVWLTVWTQDTSDALDTARKTFYLGVYGLFGLGQGNSAKYVCDIRVYNGSIWSERRIFRFHPVKIVSVLD